MTFSIPNTSQAAQLRDKGLKIASQIGFIDSMAFAFMTGDELNDEEIADGNKILGDWIDEGMRTAAQHKIAPHFVDRDVELGEAMAAFSRPILPHETRFIPISTVGNFPDPRLMTPEQNLRFRFLHDWLHFVVDAGADFAGEVSLTLAHMFSADHDSRLWRILASEVAGQASVAITTGEFPEQRLSADCWEVLFFEGLAKV